ncbi:ATP-grasp domain-containing protein [Actinosynnema sp. NPDC020468]|uniref:ATP-grasp domain-containing protein n=1 Tax=Actinosynnema sp. NPDC020468 TaxID=3154488 RepID=UPI0033F8E99C
MARQQAFVLFELMNAMVVTAREAKARGHRVVALNHDPLRDSGPFAVADGLVDEVVHVESWADQAEVDSVLKDVASRYEVVGTHSVFEATLPAQAALRTAAGLPTTSVADVRRVLDKARVRAKLYAEGLSTLKSVPLDVALGWTRWEFDRAAVLKPVNGTGSALCFEVSTTAELHDAVARVHSVHVVNPLMREYIFANGGFVLEEKAEGELLSVESMVHRGHVGFVALTGRYVLAADPVVEQGTQIPYHHPHHDAIVARTEAVHRSLGIHHGGTHVEVMVDDDGTVELIDFNPRSAGFGSPVATGAAFGIDYGKVLTDIGCGIEPDLSFARRDSGFAVEMVVLPPPGATEFRSIEFPSHCLAPRATKSPGERLTGRADQLDAIGMFIVTGATASQAHEAGLAARREVVFNGARLGDNPNNSVAYSTFIGQDLPSPFPTRNSDG